MATVGDKPRAKGRVRRPAKGALVCVYWTDAGDHAAEWTESAKPIDLRMATIGIYLGIRKHGGVQNVMLAGTKSLSDEQFNTCSQVPIGCVTKIVELTEKPDGLA